MAAAMRACAAVLRHDSILMVKHIEGTRVFWTLPGGGVGLDETPAEAAVRELFEETRLSGRVERRLWERTFSSPSKTPYREFCYLVSVDAKARPDLGTDPEIVPDRQVLAEVSWRPLAGLHADVQVSRVLKALGRA